MIFKANNAIEKNHIWINFWYVDGVNFDIMHALVIDDSKIEVYSVILRTSEVDKTFY